jgi:xanthine dehydrogenase accessory factor
MQGYWEALQRLVAEGRAFASVTLVDVVASAPANVGAKMLVTPDGLFHGSVGGGKIEAKAIGEAMALLGGDSKRMPPPATARETNTPSSAWEGTRHEGGRSTRFVEWNLQTDVGMTCGGVVRLFFEVYNVATWPIVIFGAGHCAQALVRLLLTLQCHITVIDAREEWLAKLPAPPTTGGKLRILCAQRDLKDYVIDLPRNAFVILMTMGHSSDQPILAEILRTRGNNSSTPDFPYLGVIGSAAKSGALKRGLISLGIPEQDATPGHRYLCPIGLPLGTNDPAEIAISICAQLLQVRDGLGRMNTVVEVEEENEPPMHSDLHG